MLSKRSYFFCYSVCFVPGLVFPVGGSLLKLLIFRWFRTFSFYHNDNLASIVPKSWDIAQVMQNHLNWRAEVSLHWTWYNFANPLLNNIHYVYNMQKEYVIQFFKTINKLLYNLSFAGQYKRIQRTERTRTWISGVFIRGHKQQNWTQLYGDGLYIYVPVHFVAA